ncbi:hypothetical protein I4U23_012945 [Adineta vaga]|nr:hypothetical protein I4U23_012945 [Adineta vaga]
MSCKVELIPISEGNSIVLKENEKIIVGRGSSLGCNDKKISRQHAELVLKKDETLWIKPTHINPVFYRPLNGKTTHLTKDVEQELKDGDQVGLLPTSFYFRISISKNTNNGVNEHASNHADSKPDVELKPSIQDKDSSQSESINVDKQSRKLPTWMSASTSSSSNTNNSSVKRKLSEEKDKSSNTNESSTTLGTTSVSNTIDSDNGETFDSVTPKKKKSNDKPRSRCQYGKSCYRKNPAHRTEESHPGDSDYEDDKDNKNDDITTNNNDDDDDDKPQCPYGKSCYRQNPQHKRDYKH